MNILTKTNFLERSIATSMLVVTADRIFDKGKDASNLDIGKYFKRIFKTKKETRLSKVLQK